MNSLSRLEGLMELARPYWRKNWTCDVLLQNLFRKFSLPNRRNGACLWQQTCCRKQSQMKTLWGKSSLATRRGSTVWPGDECQSTQWKSADSPRPKKARKVWSKVKVMLIVFFDMEGIVHYEYIPQGHTVNQQFYLQFWNVWDLMFLARGHRNWRRRPGRYITTMHQHTQHIPSRYFWQGMAFLSFSNHPTPLTWHRVTFGCSPN